MNNDNAFAGPYSVPGQPTDAAPGTEKKVCIMIERAARRESLFHPQDGLKKHRLALAQFAPVYPRPGSESA